MNSKGMFQRWGVAAGIAGCLCLGSRPMAQGLPAGAPQQTAVRGGGGQGRMTQPPLDLQKAMAIKITGNFTFAAAGDLIDFHPIAKRSDPDIQSILKIVQGADAAAANMEANIVDKRNYPGPWSNHTGDKDVAADIKAMGFDIVNRANNHSTDAGINTSFETARNLESQGIQYAGTGRNLDEARQARFVELPKGRIGLVGTYSSFARAGSIPATYRYGDVSGLPGANVLHLTAYHVVPQAQLDELRKMRDETYTHRDEFTYPVPPIPADEPKDTLNFWGEEFKAGTVPGGMSYRMDAQDEREIMRSIRNGKELSDFMIAIIHSHENTSLLQTYSFSEYPADFLVKFAHECIDNGADVFIGTGVHVLRSIEIYHGKPIFYGMAGFINELGTGETSLRTYLSHGANPYTTEHTSAELDYDAQAGTWMRPVDYDSVLAEVKYDNGALTQVILHPIDQGYDRPQAQRGIPRAAHGAAAQRILQQLQKISKPFGTRIEIEGEVGVIRVGQAAPQTRH